MGILIARSRAELRQHISSKKTELADAGLHPHVGFVPTMGALHEGHATLIKRSAKENALTIVSIFVNPKQFGVNEDFAKYPRVFEADCALCEKAGAQIIFAPGVDDMYPPGFRTQVSVDDLGNVLCGAYRPGHFTGVCTVVLLLLNLVGPDRSYFGLKDFQQFTIIAQMLGDLGHACRIIGVPTVREADGLAMSSRNRYLDAAARLTAGCIPQALYAAATLFLNGHKEAEILLKAARDCMNGVPHFELQYCELRRARDLSLIENVVGEDAVLAIAGFVEGAQGVRTRLIDNILLTHSPDHLEALWDFAKMMRAPD